MPNLIGKLNVLVRSSINNVLGDESGRERRPSKNIDRDTEALRQQINHALDDEDRQLKEIETLRQQIASWDQQADNALAKGDEATARHAIQQMQTQQRHLTMLEADLAQHRFSTSELIQRVNELETLVAQVRVQQPDAKEKTGEGLSDRLRQARQNVEQHLSQPAQVDTPPAKVDESIVEDDLARRRARLSQQD
jgi:phage shock protein A